MNENIRQSEIIQESAYKKLKRRKFDFVRGFILVLTSAAALILFMMWYRSWPQRFDCYRTSIRLANALNEYYDKYHQLPSVLEVLNVKKGRYDISHYTYRFIGFGGSSLHDGTIIAYCKRPHKSLFNIHVPWRHVLIFVNGKIRVQWMPEQEFQKLIKHQPKPITPYLD